MASSSKGAIVPLHLAPGSDILGDTHTHIIRSDVGYYMKLPEPLGKETPELYSLHPSCRWGDHYLGYPHKPAAAPASYYDSAIIIKEDLYLEVSDLSTGEVVRKGNLSDKCKGGDFYLAAAEFHAFSTSPIFIIIRKSDWTFQAVKDLETGKPSKHAPYTGEERYKIHSECRNGLYYWATKAFWSGDIWYYILKGVGPFGVEVHYTSDLYTDEGGKTETFDPSVTRFLPGGLSVDIGPTYGVWFLLKAIENETKNEMKWDQAVKRKHGYHKGTIHTVQHSWKLGGEAGREKGAEATLLEVIKLSFKSHFKLNAEYGGYVSDTTSEDWSEEDEVEYRAQHTIRPNSKMYIWQFKLGMSRNERQDILYTGVTRATETPEPPTDLPVRFQLNEVLGRR